jgi:hypothetical protein
MFTDYRLNNELWIEQIFDARLERFGIYETYISVSTPEWRCLTDGNSVLWVEGDEEVEFLLGFGMFNAAEKILTAIEEAFDAEIFSEHQPQYWGKEGEEECRCDRREVAEEVQTRLNILIMRHVRGESLDIEPYSGFMHVVNITKDLIIENPELASPDREAELLKKTNQICIEKYNATHGVIEQELKVATHLGYLLH